MFDLGWKCLLVFTFLVFTVDGQGQIVGDSCLRAHDRIVGFCKLPKDCPQVLHEFSIGIRPTICGPRIRKPIVCCPEAPPVDRSLKRISLQKCEEYSTYTRQQFILNPTMMGSSVSERSTCAYLAPLIIGGEKAKNGEFPHMTAIGWKTEEGSLKFLCGGSLISDRFVLTAAHCSESEGIAPSFVRLGDQNLKNRDDNMDELDVDIDKFISHEKFRSTSFYHDIAVIRMTQSVRFNKFIRPACLSQTTDVYVAKVTATGWGYTKTYATTSDELMKVDLDVVNNDNCRQQVKSKMIKLGVISSQLCAGVLKGGKDTCNGDSGGPIQTTALNNSCLFQIVGITSFGSIDCGIANWPGVYTKVASYLPWIEGKVWGSE